MDLQTNGISMLSIMRLDNYVVQRQKLHHGGLMKLHVEGNGYTLSMAGNRLFVVLGRGRMKRERFDAGSVWNSSV